MCVKSKVALGVNGQMRTGWSRLSGWMFGLELSTPARSHILSSTKGSVCKKKKQTEKKKKTVFNLGLKIFRGEKTFWNKT